MESKIEWEMTAQQVQYVLNVLAQRPYQESATTIAALQTAVQMAQAPNIPPNGELKRPAENPTPEMN